MSATLEAKVRTRAFARVIGPYVAIVTSILVVRAPELASGVFLKTVFENDVIVWVLGTFLLLGGLLIIAFHQYWSGLAAILVSLFGWFLALRGLLLLAAPQLIQRGAVAAVPNVLAVRIGFGLLALMGIWLTYIGWFTKSPASDS